MPDRVASSISEALRGQQRAEALASRLPPLLVEAERVAATVMQGTHGRRRVGSGEAFWQFRRYQAGDSVQRIDWRQSAKAGAVYIRENEWDAAQSVWLWCDRSASMEYRSKPDLPLKRERAELLLLALGSLLVRGGERIALLENGQKPVSGRYGLNRIATNVMEAPAGNAPTVDLLPRHAQAVLIGDFLAPLQDTQQIVERYSALGVRGHLLQVLDPAEETLPFQGRIIFQGLEEPETLTVPRVQGIRSAYVEKLAAHREGLAALARAAGWTFATHRTDRSPQTALLGLYGILSDRLPR